MIRFKLFSHTRSFNRREPVMRVVEQMNLGTKLFAQLVEELRDKIQIMLGGPLVFRWSVFLRGLVVHVSASDTVCALHSRNAGLRSNRFVAELNVLAHGLGRRIQIASAGVAIDQDAIARGAAE